VAGDGATVGHDGHDCEGNNRAILPTQLARQLLCYTR
jgi:hypothetical protein